MKSSIFPIAKDPVPYERRVVSVPSPIGDHVAEAVVYMPEGKVKHISCRARHVITSPL